MPVYGPRCVNPKSNIFSGLLTEEDVGGNERLRRRNHCKQNSVRMKNTIFWDVCPIRTDDWEERSATIFRLERVCELGRTLVVTSKLC
jgi:hypothetical protein